MEMITVKEVCEILKISPSSVKRWKDSGLLKPYKWGKRGVRYKRHEIIDVAENGTGMLEVKNHKGYIYKSQPRLKTPNLSEQRSKLPWEN